MVRVALAGAMLLMAASCSGFKTSRETTRVIEGPGDTVVIIHGLRWWTMGGMDSMARRFHNAGYRVVLVRYPSRKLTCDDIENGFVAKSVQAANTNRNQPIHFVAHSLGAVITHCYLQNNPPPNLGRVVFLGTPHHGTELADLIAERMPRSVRIIGPAAAKLVTTSDKLGTLRPPKFPLGVIMGDRGNYLFLSAFIPGPDDGVVAVSSGQIKGAADTLVLHEGHVEMIRSPEVFAQCKRFIETGRFDHKTMTSHEPRILLGRRSGIR